MKTLIVGGAGFIGSHLCDALLKRGDFVVVIDNMLRGKEDNIAHLANNSNFVFIKGDANDTKFLVSLIKKYQIEYIYHLAANSDIQASAKDPQIEFECTASTTWSILMAMRQCGVKKLFFASTSAIYGEHDGKMGEHDTELKPISYYGGAKMASEAFINSFAFMNDIDALIFRFPNVIGPRLTHGVIYDFINRLLKNPQELDVLGNGTQSKPYIFVLDLIDAIVLLDQKNKGLNIYNVGLETCTSVKDIAYYVVKGMGLDHCRIIFGESNIGWKGDVPHFQYNLAKIHALGWEAKHTSGQSVVATIDDYLKSINYKK